MPAITPPFWSGSRCNGVVIEELLTKEAFREAVRSARFVVVHDKTGGAKIHPADCEHLTFEHFAEKVLENQGKNGGYARVDSQQEAERVWRSLATCWG